ncbi:MAG TPA: RodZ domain-containing protein [Rhodanobacteraceae bacterium]|jgi:cytoskeleton protein RodZ|nr:RodZ domain-containing protein [Rhodanobacteraceae bacterium]
MIDREEDSRDLFDARNTQDPSPIAEHGPAADSLGARLRAAREAKGLTIPECAGALHLPIKVLERLESDDFGEPEHFVFLRGALQGYARHLGLPAGACNQALRTVAPVEQPPLVSVARTSPARWLLQRYGTAATYIVLTATIAVPLVLLGLRGGLERPSARIVSLDQAPGSAPYTAQTAAPGSDVASGGPSEASPDATPFRASMTPFAAIGLNDNADADAVQPPPVTPAPIPLAAAGQHALTLSASADCWFEISDADGNKIDSGMLHAGDSRTWHADGPLHVTLGNASGVSVTRDGQPLALDAYRHANVARFDVFAPSAGGGEND